LTTTDLDQADSHSQATRRTPLLALSQDLQLPPRVLALVATSGCETLADWKYAVLDEPADADELALWKAVRDTHALDVGGMEVLAARAQKSSFQPQQQQPMLLRKASFPMQRKHPFRGRKAKPSRSSVDLEKRMTAAEELVSTS
jgi:hypothetical protein